MEESLRLAYLEAMGIETWVFQQADLQADNAEAEDIESDLNICEPHDVRKDSSQDFHLEKSQTLSDKLIASDKNLAAQKPQLPVSSNLKNALESRNDIQPIHSDSKDIIKDPQFAFVSFWTTEGTLLLIELQDPQALGLSSSEYALLESIMFALKQKPAINVPFDKELFSWPALVGAHQDRSVAAAKQAVMAFINGKIKRQGLKTLLLLGRGVTQQAEEFLVDKKSIEVVSTVSLSDILINPSRKSSVWKAIQDLLKSKGQL